MKTLKNEVFSAVLANEQTFAGTYAELAQTVASEVPPRSGGVNAAQIKARLRVLGVVDKAEPDAVMLFEDADAATLQECTKAMRWAVVAKPIADFCDAVENMKAPEPDSKDPPTVEAEPTE